MSTVVGGGGQRVTAGPSEVPPSVLGLSVLCAAQAVAGSLVVVLVPVVATWIASSGGSASWTDVVRLALDLWLLAQHGGIVVAGGHVGIVPLGLSGAPVAACWYAGRRLARVLDPNGERIAAGLGRDRPAFPPLRALAVFAATYALVAAVAAAGAGTGTARPIPGQAFLGAGVIASVAGSLGGAGYRFGSTRAAVRRVGRLLPGWLKGWMRPAVVALLLHLAASLVLLIGLVVAHRDRFVAVHRALQPDVTGGVVLVVAQVLLLPNLVLWVACVLAGPGFALGAGTSVTTSAVVLGPLPALPVLAALPSPGPLPPAAGALPLLPVMIGVAVGQSLLRRAPSRWWRPPLDAMGVGVTVAAVFTALAWLSGGPAGPGRLAVTGPVAWRAGVALGGEVGVGALLAVVVGLGIPMLGGWAWERLRGDPALRRAWGGDEVGPDD